MIAVIGGGAAGCMAAVWAARAGAQVTLFERNEKLGKKLYITGKGRCNITNDTSMEEHRKHVFRNPRFLYSSYDFFNAETCQAFFEEAGLPVKVERGQRVFPVSDKSSDVIRALHNTLRDAGVTIKFDTRVHRLERSGSEWLVHSESSTEAFRVVVLATGGVSVPSTGSTGDGHRFAKELGHETTPLYPSLTGMDLKEHWTRSVSGLTLKNVELTMHQDGKSQSAFGDVLLTHSGVSGPIVLELSAQIPDPDRGFSLVLNLKPALSTEQLDQRLLREFATSPKKELGTVLRSMLPESIIAPFCRQASVSEKIRACDLTAESRKALVTAFHHWPMEAVGLQGMDHAVVTRGGVRVREVNPSTMMSKIHPGLFFCGELLDVDADTGGYNLQIAWSTGALAGQNAADYAQKEGWLR